MTTGGRPFPAQAAGVEESYEFCIPEDDVVAFQVTGGAGRAFVGCADEPAVRITAGADTLIALTAGTITSREATARGAQIEGAPDAIERMRSVLPPVIDGALSSAVS